jgi:hypothetical protein
MSEHPCLCRSGFALVAERILIVHPGRVQRKPGGLKETSVGSHEVRSLLGKSEGRRLPHPSPGDSVVRPSISAQLLLVYHRCVTAIAATYY